MEDWGFVKAYRSWRSFAESNGARKTRHSRDSFACVQAIFAQLIVLAVGLECGSCPTTFPESNSQFVLALAKGDGVILVFTFAMNVERMPREIAFSTNDIRVQGNDLLMNILRPSGRKCSRKNCCP